MKIIEKSLWNLVWNLLILNFIIVNCVFSNFLSVKGSCWSLDWTTKSIIIVALMISHFNYLIFFQVGRISHNLVVNWTGWCCSGVFVCYHVEIKKFVAITVSDIRLNYCSFDWIFFRFVCNLEESGDIVFIYQYIQHLGVIVFIKFLECFIYLLFGFKH